MIELLVIIAIISFISGITLINQKRPENSIKLTLEARKIAMEMRKAQNYALSSVYNCGPGGTAGGYTRRQKNCWGNWRKQE